MNVDFDSDARTPPSGGITQSTDLRDWWNEPRNDKAHRRHGSTVVPLRALVASGPAARRP